MLVSRVAPALDPAWQGWQSKKTALLWTHLLYRLQNSYNYEISDSHISGKVKIASLICQIKMKAKSHRSSTQSRSMFQQQSKPTDCSFWAPCSRVCIPSNWQLFVWVKKKKLILRRSGTSIEATLRSWVIYAVVSEEFVWRQCLGLERSMATESSKNQKGLKSMLCSQATGNCYQFWQTYYTGSWKEIGTLGRTKF